MAFQSHDPRDHTEETGCGGGRGGPRQRQRAGLPGLYALERRLQRPTPSSAEPSSSSVPGSGILSNWSQTSASLSGLERKIHSSAVSGARNVVTFPPTAHKPPMAALIAASPAAFRGMASKEPSTRRLKSPVQEPYIVPSPRSVNTGAPPPPVTVPTGEVTSKIP